MFQSDGDSCSIFLFYFGYILWLLWARLSKNNLPWVVEISTFESYVEGFTNDVWNFDLQVRDTYNMSLSIIEQLLRLIML